jgi:hypothetical protein
MPFSFSPTDPRLIRHKLANIKVAINDDDDQFRGETLYRTWMYRGHRIVLYWLVDTPEDMVDVDSYPLILEVIGEAFLWYIGQAELPPTSGAAMGDPVEVKSEWMGWSNEE